MPPRGTAGCVPWWEMGLGWHRNLAMPRKEISEGTEPSSSPQSDGRARRDIKKCFSPGGEAAGPAARGLEISKIHQGGSWWGPRADPASSRHIQGPGTSSPTASVLQIPTDPSTFPTAPPALGAARVPGFNGEQRGQGMSAVKTCPGRCCQPGNTAQNPEHP